MISPMQHIASIEPLEARIAPAAVFSYVDADGDLVKLITSKGTNQQLSNIITIGLVDSEHVEVRKIDFTKDPGTFAGTSLTMKVIANPRGGDGRGNIGAIDATGMELGDIKLLGDLGQIDAGNPMLVSPAVKSLTVGSFGVEGLKTQGDMGDLVSTLSGKVPKVTVRGDMAGASLSVVGADAELGAVKVGGSLFSASISSVGKLGSLTVGGDVIGRGTLTGQISAKEIGSVKIKGDLLGGDVNAAGSLLTTGDVGSVTIGGSLIGGNGVNSGVMLLGGKLGSLTIGRDILGGSVAGGGGSGAVSVGGDIGKVKIGGSIIAATVGTYHGTGIHSDGQIGSVVVGGSVIGGSTSNPVVISGLGDSSPSPGKNVAIGSVKIGGSAIAMRISAGIGQFETPVSALGKNGDAQIGSVMIGGDFLFSSIQAGVRSSNFLIGDADDTVIAMNNTPGTVASIARIVIGGMVKDFETPAAHTCGIVAEHIGSLKVGQVTMKLDPLGGTKDRFELGAIGRAVSVWEV